MKKEPLIVAGCCGGIALMVVILLGGLGTYLYISIEKATQAEIAKRQALEEERQRELEARRLAEEQALKNKRTGSTLVKKETRAEVAAKQAEPLYAETLNHLKKDKFIEAKTSLDSADRKMRYHKSGIINDAPGEQWIAKQEAPIREQLISQISTFEEQLANGTLDLSKLITFTKAFNYSTIIREDMSQLRTKVNSYLKGRSNYFIVVSISAPSAVYKDALKAAIRSRFPQSTRKYSLYFSDELTGYSTRPAKHLSASLKINQAEYQDQRGIRFNVPSAAVIRFTMRGEKDLETSWDTVESFVAKADLPENLQVKQYDSAVLESFQQRVAKAIESTATKIPTFSLFPGYDPSSLALLTSDGNVDPKAVEVLAALNPQRLATLVAAQRSKSHPEPVKLELCGIIVSQNLTDHQAWVVTTVKTAKTNRFGPLSKAIATRPDFADYQVITALMKQSRDWQLKSAMTDLLKTRPDDGEKVFTSLCKDTDNPNRAYHASTFLSALPEDKRSAYAGWLVDKDSAFCTNVWQALAQKPNTIKHLILEYYSKVDDSVRQNMWKSIGQNRVYAKTAAFENLLSLNTKEALNEKNDRIARAAQLALLSGLEQDEVLKQAMQLRKKLPEMRRPSYVADLLSRVPSTSSLAMNAYETLLADEQQRIGALLKQDPKTYERELYRNLRSKIIERMLYLKSKDGLGDADFNRLKTLRTTTPKDDIGLDYDIMKALQTYLYRGKADYANSSLKELVKHGMKSPLNKCRQAAYTVADTVRKKTEDPFYTKALEAAYATETDRYAKGYLKRYLKK